jgi:hypothetical protein
MLNMNILDQEDLVKGLPDDQLLRLAKMPEGPIPQYMYVSEVQRRTDMRKRFAANEPQQNMSVADQVVQEGIGAVQPTMMASSGGRTPFTAKYFNGGPTNLGQLYGSFITPEVSERVGDYVAENPAEAALMAASLPFSFAGSAPAIAGTQLVKYGAPVASRSGMLSGLRGYADDAVSGIAKFFNRGKGADGKSPDFVAGRGGTQTADDIAAQNARVINAKRLEGPPTQGPQGSQQFRYNPDNVVPPTGTSLVPKGPVRDILGDASRTGSLTTQMGVPLLFGGLGTLAASSQDDSSDPIIYPLRSEGMTYGESVNDSVGGDSMGMGFFGQTNEQRKNPTFSIDQNVAENLGSPPADSNLDRQQSILDNLMVASQEEMDEARKQVVNQAAGEVINPDLSTMRNTNADREDAAKVDPVSIAAKQYADLLGGEKNDKMRNAMMLASLGAGIAKGDTAGGLQQAANVAATYQQKEIDRAEKGLDRAIKRADTEAMQDLKRQEVEGRIGYYDVLKLNAQNEQTRLAQTADLKAAERDASYRQTATRILNQGLEQALKNVPKYKTMTDAEQAAVRRNILNQTADITLRYEGSAYAPFLDQLINSMAGATGGESLSSSYKVTEVR